MIIMSICRVELSLQSYLSENILEQTKQRLIQIVAKEVRPIETLAGTKDTSEKMIAKF